MGIGFPFSGKQTYRIPFPKRSNAIRIGTDGFDGGNNF